MPPQRTRWRSAIPGPPDAELVAQLSHAVGGEPMGLLLGDPLLEPRLVVPRAGVLPDDQRGLAAVRAQLGDEGRVRLGVCEPAVPADVLGEFAPEVVEQEPA